MVADTKVIERVAILLAVPLVVCAIVWCNSLQAKFDYLNQKLSIIAGESKSMKEWAQRSDAENAHLRYLRPLSSRYEKERKAGKSKAEAAKAAAEGWR